MKQGVALPLEERPHPGSANHFQGQVLGFIGVILGLYPPTLGGVLDGFST